mmetsp:Transcript_13577/g.42242  ORF Transcript_13577/g.42242 Transcript_13577/m.42242 type:complete len:593 (-) Transcript_13577:431-2209(-)
MGCASSKEDDPRDPVFTAPPSHNDDSAARAELHSNPREGEGGATAVLARRTFEHRPAAAPDSPGALLAAQAAAAEPSPASLAAASVPNTPACGLGTEFEDEPASDDESDGPLPDAHDYVAAAEEDTPSVAATVQPDCAAARPNPRSGLARKLSLRNVKTVVATANPLAGINVEAADPADFDPPEAGSTHSDVSSRSVKSRVDAGCLSGMHRFEAIATLPAPAAGSATTTVAAAGSNITTAAAATAAAASATSGLASSRRWAEDDDEPASAVAMSLLGGTAAAAAARSNKPPLAGGARQPFAPPEPSVAVQRLRSCDLRIPSEPKTGNSAFELPRAAVDAAPGTKVPPAKSKFLRAGDAFKKRGVPSPQNTPPALRSGTATCDAPACVRPVGVEEEDSAVSPESEMVLSCHPQLSDIIRNASAATRRQWAQAKLREPAPLLSNVKLRRVEEWLASLGRSPAPVPQLGGPGARPVGLSPRNLSRNASILMGMEGRRTCSTSISNSVDGDIARRRRSSARPRSNAGPLASATTAMAVAEYQLDGVPDGSTDALQREIAALADSKFVQSTMGFSRDSVKGSQCPVDPPLIGPPLAQ